MRDFATPFGAGRLVLCIVEDPDLSAVVRQGLELCGFRTRFEACQLDAAQAARDPEVDTLLLDMGCLGRGTVGLVRLLRRHGSAMPVLVLAGDPRVDDVFEVLHAGADDFIRKPVLGPDHVALAMRRFHKYRAAAADADRLRLEQAQARKAEELSLDKLRFFRFASHELKSPLVAVQSNLRTIREIFGDRVPEEVREMLGRSGARLDQLLGMINDLLALSVDRSDIRDYWQVVDLSQLVRDALSHLAPVARERGVTVEARLPRRRVTLVCNLYGLEKAVGNLLSNAVRYTPAGGRATVELERKDHFQVIRVSDTGIGIPAEDREKVFDEFYRAKNARAAVSFGSGLGLALVKKVVLEHGGWIDLQSVEGEGTTISLWLPVRAPEPQA